MLKDEFTLNECEHESDVNLNSFLGILMNDDEDDERKFQVCTCLVQMSRHESFTLSDYDCEIRVANWQSHLAFKPTDANVTESLVFAFAKCKYTLNEHKICVCLCVCGIASLSIPNLRVSFTASVSTVKTQVRLSPAIEQAHTVRIPSQSRCFIQAHEPALNVTKPIDLTDYFATLTVRVVFVLLLNMIYLV